MYLKTFFVLTAIVLVKSDCDGSDECLSDSNKNKTSNKEDSKHKLNINSDGNDFNDDNNKPPEFIQLNNNLDKTLSKVFSDVSSLVEDELKEVFGVKQDINLHKNFDDKTQIHLKAYTLSDKDKIQHPLFNVQDVKLPEIARSNNITKLKEELSSLKEKVGKSIEKEIEDFILKIIEYEALDWINKELGEDVPPATKETTPKPVTNPKINTKASKLTTLLTTTTTRPTASISVATSSAVSNNIVTRNPVTISKVPDISVKITNSISSSSPSSVGSTVGPISPSSPVTATKNYTTTINPVVTPKGSIIPISITTKTLSTSSLSLRPSSSQVPLATTTENYVSTKIFTKSPVTAKIATEKSLSPTNSSSPKPSSPQVPSVTTIESYVTTKLSPKGPVTAMIVTEKSLLPTSLSSPRPSSPQVSLVTTTESYVTTKISAKSPVTATIATEKSSSLKSLSTSSSSPSTISTVPPINTSAIKVNNIIISKSTTDTKNILDEKKNDSTTKIPSVPMQTDPILINATIEMDEEVDIETDSPDTATPKPQAREGILNINLIKDNEILDDEYYEIPDDNSTDYPIIDYVEMYRDITNENRIYRPTNVPDTVTFREQFDLENDVYNETVYKQNNGTHNVTTT